MSTPRFQALLWRDDTQTLLDWFHIRADPPPTGGGLNLAIVLGPESQAMNANLARNIRDNRLGVLAAVLTRGF